MNAHDARRALNASDALEPHRCIMHTQAGNTKDIHRKYNSNKQPLMHENIKETMCSEERSVSLPAYPCSHVSRHIVLVVAPRFQRNWTFARSTSLVFQLCHAKLQGQRQYGIRVLVVHAGPSLRRLPRWLTCASRRVEPTL